MHNVLAGSTVIGWPTIIYCIKSLFVSVFLFSSTLFTADMTRYQCAGREHRMCMYSFVWYMYGIKVYVQVFNLNVW